MRVEPMMLHHSHHSWWRSQCMSLPTELSWPCCSHWPSPKTYLHLKPPLHLALTPSMLLSSSLSAPGSEASDVISPVVQSIRPCPHWFTISNECNLKQQQSANIIEAYLGLHQLQPNFSHTASFGCCEFLNLVLILPPPPQPPPPTLPPYSNGEKRFFTEQRNQRHKIPNMHPDDSPF